MIFGNNIDRTRLDGKREDEGDFDYLNVSNRAEAARVRDFLESCLGEYPNEHRAEIIQRLRESDIQFASAAFELFLYACFLRMGWTVDVHPEVPDGNGRRPDFRVHTGTAEAFYVEATLARQFSDAELAAERRKAEVLRAIDDMPCPDFVLDLDVEGSPRTNVPRKNLRHRIRRWIDSLDASAVEAQIREGHAREELRYEHDGWTILIRAIPRRPGRASGGRTIGIRSLGIRSVNIAQAVKSAAKSKASRYGNLDLPLVVAINVEEEFADVTLERDALFGQLQFWIPRDGSHGQRQVVRLPDGVWHGPHGPQHTRLSGVWLFRRFDPWHFVARGSNLLYVNLWATLPVPPGALQFPHATVENGRLVEHEGTAFRDVFGLDANWPNEPDAATSAPQLGAM
ncbi:hypothetical protein PQR34_34625 [Paraburkholderia sediminicola]|uniref:hypothetical protein n=1 Tax=Paraburkholderia sediminicola TaxID=458836 RepID=UPI0038B707F7